MADNFNMRQFLFENKLGAYSKLKEVEEAKNVSKEQKIQVVKEWIWYTCDEGQAKDDINKYNKMVDMYFADKEDVAKEDFKKIYTKVSEKYGVGDIGADFESFESDWKDVQRGKLINPEKQYEGEAAYEYEKGKEAGEKLAKEDYAGAEEEKMMDFLAEEDPLKEDASQVVIDILGVLAGLAGMGLSGAQILKWQDKLEKENPELHRQLGKVSSTIGGADPSKNLEENEDAGGIETDIEMDLAYAEDPIFYLKSIIDFCTKKIKEIEQNGSEDSEMQEAKKEEGYMGTQYDSSEDMAVDMIKKGIYERLSPEMFERMDALTSTRAQLAMIKAAEIMMNELTEEGFEVLDIREYFTQLIANDI